MSASWPGRSGRLPVGVADAPNYPPMTSPGAREAIRAGGYRIGDPGPVTMLGGGSEVGQTIGTRGDTLMRNHALGAQVARQPLGVVVLAQATGAVVRELLQKTHGVTACDESVNDCKVWPLRCQKHGFSGHACLASS